MQKKSRATGKPKWSAFAPTHGQPDRSTNVVNTLLVLNPSRPQHTPKRFNLFFSHRDILPVTLEVWGKPGDYRDENCQFSIGSDIPGEYDLGIAICGSVLSFEHVERMVNSTAAVPPNRWSRVATVFTGTESRLYLICKFVATAPGSKLEGEAPFVIEIAGLSNLIVFYRGEIRPLQIWQGERYSSSFKSQPS